MYRADSLQRKALHQGRVTLSIALLKCARPCGRDTERYDVALRLTDIKQG